MKYWIGFSFLCSMYILRVNRFKIGLQLVTLMSFWKTEFVLTMTGLISTGKLISLRKHVWNDTKSCGNTNSFFYVAILSDNKVSLRLKNGSTGLSIGKIMKVLGILGQPRMRQEEILSNTQSLCIPVEKTKLRHWKKLFLHQNLT